MNENNTNINCLPCIYTVHCLNTYKIGNLANEVLQVLIKKEEIIKKIS